MSSTAPRGTGEPVLPGTIRKLDISERAEVRDHLLRLDPEDRRLRFLGSVDDAAIAAYGDTIFTSGVIALGCSVHGVLRAVGELRYRMESGGLVGEVAITVERDWQNQGIGTEMLRRLIELARNRSIKTLHLYCLGDNTRMQVVVRKLGGELRYVDGTVEADIAQPWPSCWSLLGEALADGQAVLQAWWGDPT